MVLGTNGRITYLFPQVAVKRADTPPQVAVGGAQHLVLYVDDQGFAYTSPTNMSEAEIRHAKDLFAQGKFSEALPLYRKLVSWDDENAQAQYRYAFCLQTIGRLEEASASYSKALALDPALERWVRYNVRFR